jgi:hypothetical protein
VTTEVSNQLTGDEIKAAIEIRVATAQNHLDALLSQKKALGPLIVDARTELADAKTYLPRKPRTPKPAAAPAAEPAPEVAPE